MKKLTILAGTLTLGLASLNASGIASMSGNNDYDSDDTLNQRRQHIVKECLDEVASAISIGYVGGYFGPTDTLIAMSGVYDVPLSTNAQGNLIQLPREWAHGLEIVGTLNLQNSTALRLEYLGVFNKTSSNQGSPLGAVEVKLANGGVLEAETDLRQGVTYYDSYYTLNHMNEFIFSTINPIMNLPTFQVLGKLGLESTFIDHKSIYSHLDEVDSSLTGGVTSQQIYGGPLIGLIMVKEWLGIFFEGGIDWGMNCSKNNTTYTTKEAGDIQIDSTSSNYHNYFQKTRINFSVLYGYEIDENVEIFGALGYTGSIANNSSNVMGGYEPMSAGNNTNMCASYLNFTIGASF